MGISDVEYAALDPSPPDNGRAARAAPGESVVATDDAELRALEAAAIAEVTLPANGHVVGEVACTALEAA